MINIIMLTNLNLLLKVSSTPGQNLFNGISPYLSTIIGIVTIIVAITCLWKLQIRNLILVLLIGCSLYYFSKDIQNMDKIGEVIFEKILAILKEIEKSK
jgi:hypothetical protein